MFCIDNLTLLISSTGYWRKEGGPRYWLIPQIALADLVVTRYRKMQLQKTA